MNPLMDSQYEEVMEKGVRQEVGSTDSSQGSLRGVSLGLCLVQALSYISFP